MTSHTTRVVLAGLVLALLVQFPPPASAQAPSTSSWIATGSMNLPRYGHTATLLPNGKVLIVGGTDCNPQTRSPDYMRAELYDPATGRFSLTGALDTCRAKHTATLLPDGRVVIIGGLDFSGHSGTIEIYNPATGTFTVAATLGFHTIDHTATLLPDGKILIILGELSRYQPHGPFEASRPYLFDPATGALSRTGPINRPRKYHTATRLQDGKVLVFSGQLNASPSGMSVDELELYDPATKTFSVVGTCPYAWVFMRSPQGLVLQDGRVLLGPAETSGFYTNGFDAYDPASRTLQRLGVTVEARANPKSVTTTLLPNGLVLIAGGSVWNDSEKYRPEAELFDPLTGKSLATASMTEARGHHVATLLQDGRVLVAGGSRDGKMLQSADLYQYVASVPPITVPKAPAHLTATALSSSEVALRWEDSSDNEEGFKLDQAVGNGMFSEVGSLGANVTSVTVTRLSAATTYQYHLRAFNKAGYSGFSNTVTVTTAGQVQAVSRFINHTSYPFVSLVVDGVQYIPDAQSIVLPGKSKELPLAERTHSYQVVNGTWTQQQPSGLYEWSQTYSQTGGTVEFQFFDWTIEQLLTLNRPDGKWEGSYWDENDAEYFADFCFTSQGKWTLHADGEFVGTGTYSLVGRNPGAQTVTFTVGPKEGTLPEAGSVFSMRNGPPSWPLIQYQHVGDCD